ncbi:hypothetical protein [Thalassobellus suaedae]|uniref:PKD/Chitinase domain-containing protein n=1 Tax=Thalassobellus suaedae TaxID=3074124 RepID=A0ABY9XWX6_9FLAO|nr:hypothetical protein RHP51_07320 [Flavobacteriaceae bacterium HL-DH14]
MKDAYGCIKEADVPIILDAEPTINPIPQQCYDGTPISITLVEGTGIAITPLTYSIGGAYQSSPNITINAPGVYTVSIKDGNGCIASTTYVVEEPVLLDAFLDTDLTCDADAIINLSVTGGSGTYSYEILAPVSATGNISGATSGVFTGLNEAGSYIFRVTDDQGCQAESNAITVTPNITPTFTTQVFDVTCNGGADGSIIVTATDGIAPYEYRKSDDGGTNWDAWQTSNVFDGLAEGIYTIQVRDSKNCESLPVAVPVDDPDLVVADAQVTTTLSCGTGNVTAPAEVTVTATGGTAPYTYSFDGVNYTSTNTYITYNPGTVTAWVKDVNGCIVDTPATADIEPLSVPTDLTFVSTPVTCLAVTSDVTLTAIDGVGALTYEIISPVSATGNTTGASNGIFTGLAPDTYVFTVTDANGCYYTESYTVVPVTNITVSGLLFSDVNCNTEANGAVEFTVSNFGSTYSYTINGVGPVTNQTSTTINLTGLSVGNQTIVVTDETTGCTDTFTVTVNEPTLLTLVEANNFNANCNFGAQVTVEATGGTSPYQYAFIVSGAAVDSDYSNSNSAVLDPAISTTWVAWVRDANGCIDDINITIDTDPLPTVTVPGITDNQCNLNGDPFTFTVTNPTGVEIFFSYSIGGGFQTSPTFTVSTPGTYIVTVKDDNGCTADSTTPITIYPALNLNAAITTLPSCTDDDGVITVNGTGGSGNYSYAISPNVGSISGNVISGIPSGTYTVTITDIDTGCNNTAAITLDEATPVTFTTTPTDVSCNGSSDGTITVNLPATNDNPIYTYSLDGGVTTQTSNVFTGLAPGVYNVTVTSGRNCTLTQQETVGEPNVIVVPTPTVVEYTCTPDTNAANFASITVSGVTGGSNNYVIYEFIRSGTIVQSGANNVYNEADFLGGNYTINVYDENGCLGTSTAVITPYVELEEINITIDTAISCVNDEDITVSASATGAATPQFTIEGVDVSYNQTNNTGSFTSLTVGNYIITVENTDTGCSLQTVHYVSEPNTFELDVESITDVTCFSDNNGSVTFTLVDRLPTPTDEAGPFAYEVLDASGASVNTGTSADSGPVTISGLVSGTYIINATLTNAPFCTVTTNVTITAPNAPLEIQTSHTDITCIGADGSISASATGGWYQVVMSIN